MGYVSSWAHQLAPRRCLPSTSSYQKQTAPEGPPALGFCFSTSLLKPLWEGVRAREPSLVVPAHLASVKRTAPGKEELGG